MVRIILFTVLIVSFVCYPWVGKAYSWILTPVVSNELGAVLIGCCLIFSVIGLWNTFVSKTQLFATGSRKNIQKRKGTKE